MDFTDQLSEQSEKFEIENSEGANMLHDVQAQQKTEEDKKQDDKFVSAFESSDLSEMGPSSDEYDYGAEHLEGNSFKSGEDGGITLKNINIKPFTKEIAGHDIVTGKKFTDEYYDRDGYLKEGIDTLRESNMNTVTGASIDDVVPLAKIANGVMLSDKGYDDFIKTVGSSWSDEQKKTAWDSAQATKQVMNDVKDLGARYTEFEFTGERGFKPDPSLSDPDKSEEKPEEEGIQKDIDEGELVNSTTWMDSGRKMIEYFDPEGLERMTDEEVHQWNLDMASEFNYNIPMMMFYANEIIQSEDQELARSMLFILNQNDETNYSWNSFGRGGLNLALDPTTYVTMGGGILVSRAAGLGMKTGIKKALTQLAAITALEAPIGAAIGVGVDVAKQTVEIGAGERKEISKTQAAGAGAIGAAASIVVGAAAGAVTDPVIRKFGADAMKKGYKNLTGTRPGPYSGQRGSISIGTPQVRFQSELGKEIDRVFEGKNRVSIKKLKNKIRGWLGEGKVRQEEVDWSGLNLADDADTVSRADMKAFLNQRRPIPEIFDVVETRFQEYSLGNPKGGYREKIISIEGQGEYGGSQYHFGEVAGKGRAIVGHLRMTTSKHNGTRGTMLLEGQSDIRKVPRHETRARTEVGKQIKKKKDKSMLAELAKERSSIEGEIDKLMKTELDPTDTRLNDLQRRLDKITLTEGEAYYPDPDISVPFTPYRDKKSSNSLMFRAAVMDAMNDGSEFLSWPGTAEQVGVIQGWTEDTMWASKSVTDQYTKDFPKIAKSYGFKVEEYVPDEFKNKTRRGPNLDRPDIEDTSDNWIRWYKSKWGVTFSETQQGIPEMIVTAYDSTGNKLIKGEISEVFDFLDNTLEGAGIVDIPFPDNKFSRIVFDKETKAKWRKEGAAMYSFGAPAIVAGHSVDGQKRDKEGKFK